MAATAAPWLAFLLIALHLTLCLSSPTPKTYIIQMAKSKMPSSFTHHLHWYTSTLNSITTTSKLESSEADPSTKLIYTYDTAFHGFAASLTSSQASQLAAAEGVLAVFPETIYTLHTTRSPTFLGIEPQLSSSAFTGSTADHNVIVGVLDTGIWPESPSFNDKNLPPIPPHWKGTCELGRGFTRNNCNRKIVGARIFYKGYEASTGAIDEKGEYKSPRDQDGHGTHTAATATGSPVPGANLFGYARGTARGMAPRARIAAYKVCWAGGCFSSDIMAAVDQAVADGVDVLSISLGGGVSSYYRDSLSVAAFGAMEKGVFVACSAGNSGPEPISLTNVSPWITTVGASTMDRDFPATAKLGNDMNVSGVSLYKGRASLSPRRQYPLIYMGGNSTSSPDPRSLCLEGTLDRRTVAGKIVICDRGINPRVQKGQVVKDAGGLGMILANTAANGEELVADSHLLPALAVGQTAGNVIKDYSKISSRRSPTATLSFQGTKVGIRPSPVVAAFSSRGPNILTLEVLKPDLVAPGVNILAAWTGLTSPSSLASDLRRVSFNILSGTSMSCPHVAGIAALIKASHPTWSPAAIKSALMTTAYVHDNTYRPLKDAATGSPSTPYDHGAGHIRPMKALDPGLVYDISPADYVEFLCTQKLTPLQLKVFTKSNQTCKHTMATPGDLNYPAISAIFREQPAAPLTLYRTVTNVGPPDSTYHAKITPLAGAEAVVEPTILRFTKQNQKLSYKITFKTKSPQEGPVFGALTWSHGAHSFKTKSPQEGPVFGALTWSHGAHSVRSTIVLTWLPAL